MMKRTEHLNLVQIMDHRTRQKYGRMSINMNFVKILYHKIQQYSGGIRMLIMRAI